MPIGYQNQSTVWFLGGSNVNVNGYGSGTFDGSGQVVSPLSAPCSKFATLILAVV